jgi:hypothetical protein
MMKYFGLLFLLVACLSSSAFSYPSARGLEFSVASDLDGLLSDIVNEGDRVARVNWRTRNGAPVPRVSCEKTGSSYYTCTVEVAIKIEDVRGKAYTTCEGLTYKWTRNELTRIEPKANSPFDACVEDVATTEVD